MVVKNSRIVDELLGHGSRISRRVVNDEFFRYMRVR